MRLADTFRKAMKSAWMPFAACLLLLLYTVSVDLLESTLAQEAVLPLSFINPFVAVILLSLIAVGILFALYFLIRRNWRQFFWRIILIVAGIDIMFLAGERWSGYARENLSKILVVHVAGPRLAVVNDKLITDSDSLIKLGRKLLYHANPPTAVFVCEADIQSSDFAHNFAFPCLSAGIWRFAFNVRNSKSEIDRDLQFSMPDTHMLKYMTDDIGTGALKFAGVRISPDGSLSFSADCDPNETEDFPEGEEPHERKDTFTSPEEAVLGEGRGAEFTAAIVLADMGCRLSDITRTIRRLHESGYKDVVLYFV